MLDLPDLDAKKEGNYSCQATWQLSPSESLTIEAASYVNVRCKFFHLLQNLSLKVKVCCLDLLLPEVEICTNAHVWRPCNLFILHCLIDRLSRMRSHWH